MRQRRTPKLAQHFLKNERLAEKIASALNPVILKNGTVGRESFETILEIGPGEGMLTRYLLKQEAKVIAVEKDEALVKVLRQKFASEIKNKKLRIIFGDIRDFKPEKVFKQKSKIAKYVLIANIPYYLTGLIIRKFLECKHPPEALALLIQKEVAERIVARDKKGSLLSLSVKVYGEPKIFMKVSRGSFNPPPKVDSAVLVIEKISKKNFKDISEEKFFSVLRAGFAHPRKLVMKNLGVVSAKEKITEAFSNMNLLKNSRAENLSLENWLSLAKKL